jgi:hypothetical protein
MKKDQHKNINAWQSNGAVHAHSTFVVQEILSPEVDYHFPAFFLILFFTCSLLAAS